jgi:hypothetical protein
MKVFTSPIPVPEFSEFYVDGKFDIGKMTEIEAAYTASVAKWLTDHGYHHKLTGQIVRFPVADGAAEYMIMNGTSMLHLPLGDAWQIPDAHARGIRITDIRNELDRSRKIRELFAQKEK